MRAISRTHGFMAAVLAGLLFPYMTAHGQAMLQIEGTATYRERIALPPDAVFDAVLEDVSRADVAAPTLGEARIDQPGNPPVHFTIQYDPTQIRPDHIYAVRVRITEGGRLLFTTDQRYQVLTQGHGSEIGMIMLRKASGGSAETRTTAVTLRETYWKLVELGDSPITDADQQNEAHLIFQTESSRVVGSGGCNRLTGGYTLNGRSLRFGAMAATRMACMRGMETEGKFLAAMERVRSWKITNQQLDLLDENGKLLVRLTAQAAKPR
jgi:putative lipoprotein